MAENAGNDGRKGKSGDGSKPAPNASTPLHQKRGTLYDILGVEKTATDGEIKSAYRKLALRYHPDKNLQGTQAIEEKFKEINKANTILSDPRKRKIYDNWGDMGLKMMEQFGEERVATLADICSKRWLKWLSLALFVVTLGCFGCFCCCLCCFQCCCNCCCGKYAPAMDEEQMRMWGMDAESRQSHLAQNSTANASRQATGTSTVITVPEEESS